MSDRPADGDTGYSSQPYESSTDGGLAENTLPGSNYYDTQNDSRAGSHFPGIYQGQEPDSNVPIPPPPPLAPPPEKLQRLSPGMLIALTIAIVVPPTLLLGAILGYVVAVR